MSYYLFITRKGLCYMPVGPVITADEWLAYVATDSQLKLIPGRKTHEVTVDIPSLRPINLSWSSHSGAVYTDRPDVAMLAKMLQIASALGAKVQGEQGEVYGVADLRDGFFAGISVRGVDRNEPQAT